MKGDAMAKNTATKNRFLELRAGGMSYAAISAELGINKQTLIDWSREMQSELSNLRSVELEALREKYAMTARARVEILGDTLAAIRAELGKRDLSKVPTEKLFSLLLKHLELINHETPVFTAEQEISEWVTAKHKETWTG